MSLIPVITSIAVGITFIFAYHLLKNKDPRFNESDMDDATIEIVINDADDSDLQNEETNLENDGNDENETHDESGDEDSNENKNEANELLKSIASLITPPIHVTYDSVISSREELVEALNTHVNTVLRCYSGNDSPNFHVTTDTILTKSEIDSAANSYKNTLRVTNTQE